MSSSPTRSDHTRFMILGSPRSGSNWLQESLSTNPDIEAHGELLDKPNMLDPAFAADPWEGLKAAWAAGNKAARGFKLFYFHCWDAYPQCRWVWDRLRDDEGIKVVLLTRRNLLRLVASWELAEATNVWSATAPMGARPKAFLDPRTIVARMDAVRDGVSRVAGMFAGHARYPISYENLFASPTAYLDGIQRFLGVEPRPLSCGLVKMEGRRLCDAIENYEEVSRAVAASPYGEFLD